MHAHHVGERHIKKGIIHPGAVPDGFAKGAELFLRHLSNIPDGTVDGDVGSVGDRGEEGDVDGEKLVFKEDPSAVGLFLGQQVGEQAAPPGSFWG